MRLESVKPKRRPLRDSELSGGASDPTVETVG
jgi:hypothetical protein